MLCWMWYFVFVGRNWFVNCIVIVVVLLCVLILVFMSCVSCRILILCLFFWWKVIISWLCIVCKCCLFGCWVGIFCRCGINFRMKWVVNCVLVIWVCVCLKLVKMVWIILLVYWYVFSCRMGNGVLCCIIICLVVMNCYSVFWFFRVVCCSCILNLI